MNNTEIKFSTVTVPSYAGFSAETLFEARSGELTSGLCRDTQEAYDRIMALLRGEKPATEAPDYQANTQEMTVAWQKLQTLGIRDGGMCRRAVEAAMKAGIHTIDWAIASRYLVAGWV